MNISSYHQHLLSDLERLSGFKETIEKEAHGIVYDLGSGTGILASWAAPHADFVYAIEKDKQIASMAQINLSKFNNTKVLIENALNFVFPEKADIIICEMLDTALIDEEQIPVLNNVQKYLNPHGIVIPMGVLNGVELIYFEKEHICYEEDDHPQIKVKSPLKIYQKVQFNQENLEQVDLKINLETYKEGWVNGIRITTFTLLTPQIVCGPTKMLNPPLLIPLKPQYTGSGEELTIKLAYEMGGGLNTLKARII
jgi:predicted RNA methylase